MKGNIILGIGIVVILASCRATKKIQTAVAKKDSVAIITPPVLPTGEDSAALIRENFHQIQQNHVEFTSFLR